VFERILHWCSDAGDKILTVHSRRSSADVIAAIGADFRGVVILHWFSGPLRELHAAIGNGYYFSVNPAMTRSEQGLRLIRDIPKDRLLTESDGPFVSVERAQATPSATEAVCAAVAEIWDCSGEDVKDTVRQNFNRVLNGKGTHG
jgi:TatD DNase family protein